MPTAAEIAQAILDAPIGDTAWPARTVRDVLKDVEAQRDGLEGGGAAKGKTPHAIAAGSPLGKLLAVPAAVAALTVKVDQLAADPASS